MNKEHVISLDIQNVTNRQNVWAEYYDTDEEQIDNYPMAALILFWLTEWSFKGKEGLKQRALPRFIEGALSFVVITGQLKP